MQILDNNIAVLENDTHVSKWIIEHNRLDIARTYLEEFKHLIPIGGTVVDVGAMLGAHTSVYSDYVGPTGLVYAFEPNPKAYECLLHNTANLLNVLCFDVALSDKKGFATLKESDNAGASYVVSGKKGSIPTVTLDSQLITGVSFLKIDVEGYEVRVLNGAQQTIARDRPVILCEVNDVALDRAGTSKEKLLKLLVDMNYNIKITDDRIQWSDPQYDVLCIPNEKTH